MMMWISAVGMGILLGFLGRVSISLSYYIRKIEDGTECAQCAKQTGCFARKRMIGMDFLYVDQLTLYAFCRVRSLCPFWTKCGKRESLLYILSSTILTGILFWSKGISMDTILYSIAVAALLSLSVVDWNTEYIPLEYNLIILCCGLIRLFLDLSNWEEYLIGLIAVSGFLCIVNRISVPVLKRRYADQGIEVDSAIGDGDIKLMAATGLLLGWKLNFIALGMGCIAGSVIHLIRMAVCKGDRQFALGPYLSLGVYLAIVCGRQLVSWYLNMMGLELV